MPKVKNLRRLTLTLFLVCNPLLSQADQILLTNGDKLSGNLIHLEDEMLEWHSDRLGNFVFPLDEIESLETVTPVVVLFSNADQVKGRIKLSASEGGKLITERFGEIEFTSFSEIHAIRAISTMPVVKERTESRPKASPITERDTDEVILVTGDRLLGDITRLEGETLVIKTKFAGELTVKKSEISQLNTKSPMTIIFQDGEYITGIINSSKEKQLELSSQKLDRTKSFDLANVQSIVRGDPREKVLEERRVKLSGRLDIGLSRSSGNSDNENYSGYGELRARTIENRFTVRGEKVLEKSDGDKTEDKTFGSMKYDHFLSEKWFMFGSASFEEDEIERLNLRTALSAGLGYQFFERDDLFLSFEAGPAYVNEDFDEDEDNDSVSMRWGIDYEHDLFSWASIFHFQDGLFGLETTEDIVIRTRSGVRFPLGNGFSATAAANIDWDKSPAEGADTTDKEYIFSLGYEF